jgi:hypothetical protein
MEGRSRLGAPGLGSTSALSPWRRRQHWDGDPPCAPTPPAKSPEARPVIRDQGKAAIGIEPQGLAAALASNRATVQDRFAGLYFIEPAIFTVLPFFWIMTGIISLTTG